MNFIEISKIYWICLMSRLVCFREKTVFTRSRIQWETKVEKPIRKWFYPQLLSHTGKVDGCEFYVYIYGWYGYWHWNIRSEKFGGDNLIVGSRSFRSLRDAKDHATKWAVVQFLRQIDPKLFRSYHGHNTLCWIESI